MSERGGMDKAPATNVEIQPSCIPQHVQRQLAAVLLRSIRRTQREDPVIWARIEARAAQIRRENTAACGAGAEARHETKDDEGVQNDEGREGSGEDHRGGYRTGAD